LYRPYIAGHSIDTHKAQTMKPLHKIDRPLVKGLLLPRQPMGDKRTFGHCLVIGGSQGMMGSVVFCSKASIESGCGLVSTYCPNIGLSVMQTLVPEAMCLPTRNAQSLEKLEIKTFEKYDAVALGCGMGLSEATHDFFHTLMEKKLPPLVIDADGLNHLAKSPQLLSQIAPNSILTPHDREFSRLFGSFANLEDKLSIAQSYAFKYNLHIVCKGSPTHLVSSKGIFQNTTGNHGMATAGSGDCLTGIIASLLAQKYPPLSAALLGVFLHGLAGDLAQQKFTAYGVTASRIIESLPYAFRKILEE
jgi:ADP-dependent NAD(P)H-hydrate dehydratase / NAD(P)H-hydrate epimerase